MFGDSNTEIKNFESLGTINTGSGNDTIAGSPSYFANISTDSGNDRIEFNSDIGVDDGAIVDGGIGSDILIVDFTQANFPGLGSYGFGIYNFNYSEGIYSSNNSTRILSYLSIETLNITGTIYQDDLTGLAGNDTLNGGLGNDNMTGGLGNDTYIVDSIGDTVTEYNSEGTDTVQSNFTYTLGTNLENLILTGTLAINGIGNNLHNRLTGNTANNILNGGVGNDILNGGVGNDILNGEVGNDFLLGSFGSDTLDGGDGNDTLDGGVGKDLLSGGIGNDRFIYSKLTDRGDNIDGFAITNDVIVLSSLFDNLDYIDIDPIADGYMRLIQSGSNTQIQIDADGLGSAIFITLTTLNNTIASSLTSSNFLF